MSLPLPIMQRVTTRDGEMLSPRFDRYVGLSLDVYGEYSRDEREALTAFLSPGDTVVQAGANIGSLTIPLARAVGPSGKVFAFEPQELCYRAIVANSLLTNQYHIEAVRAAVGSSSGVACLPVVDYGSVGNFGGISLSAEQTSVKVRLVTLDEALAGVAACRLLHIDVEGAEMDVLAGAEQFITRTRPILCIEIDRPEVRDALPAWLAAHRYVGYEHHPALFSAENWRGQQQNVFQDASGVQIVSLNCLAVPAERMDAESARLPAYSSLQPFGQEETANV